jgi:beta-phosphoglucomutase-like phosphatase (HAD superfamily)
VTADRPQGVRDDASTLEAVVAVVFDFDGTLVDTMPLHYEAYRRAFAECCGADLSADAFYADIGGTAREVIPKLLARLGCAADPLVVHARKQELLHEVLVDTEIPVLETAKLLPVLRDRLPMALASSGSRQGIELMLERLGWTGYFDAIVTGEDVAAGKPAPDAFELAARRLGVDPSRCLAFEDTPAGLASARAAGMAVFDVGGVAMARPVRPTREQAP